MQQLNAKEIVPLLKKMTFKTVGCTEPAAIALAVVAAYEQIGGTLQSVNVTLDKNVYKNAMAVGIPGTNAKGPLMAIALGLACGDSKNGLLLLENANESAVVAAEALLKQNIISVNLNESAASLHIQAELVSSNGTAKAIISQCHDNIVLIEKNGTVIFHRIANSSEQTNYLDEYDFANIDIAQLIKAILAVPAKDLEFLLDGFALNQQAALLGLQTECGMKLGNAYQTLISKKIFADSLENRIKTLVSSAVDARMGGLKVPIFGCAGSGNHGIMFFLTVGLCLEHFVATAKIALVHALAFGLVILAAIKKRLGLLSSSCGGAVAGAAAAAAAITFALAGTTAQIENAIALVLGDIAGMICDGAKFGCALKIATGASSALDAALLALEGSHIPETDGIVGKNLNETLANLELLSNKGMAKIDETVLAVLRNKTAR